jgi:hypothetical protein
VLPAPVPFVAHPGIEQRLVRATPAIVPEP